MCFASSTWSATFKVVETYPDNETEWQPDARMLLYATSEGNEYLIAPEDENWNSYYLEIILEEDLDGDFVDFNDDELEGGRHSAKASFMAKVLSPLLGYGTDYELMQYVFVYLD